MKFPALSRTGFAVALSAVLGSLVAPVMAQEQGSSIFSQVAPSMRDRLFFRINYINANVKTSSGDAYDVTGKVVTLDDIKQLGRGGSYIYPGNSRRREYYDPTSPTAAFTTAYGVLSSSLAKDVALGCENEQGGLGTPCGMRARSQSTVSTPSLSLGYYLTEDFDWAIEAQVLAAPLSVDIYGDGPTALNGQKIIKLKMLPPVFTFGRYFGAKGDAIQPYAGIAGSYAYFYDVQATDFLNSYVGGSSEGDTTIKLKNAVGFGPFLGLKANISNEWFMGLNFGKLRYKTEATITTNNTVINQNSAVLNAYGPNAQLAISAGTSILQTTLGANDGINNLMCDLAAAKYGSTTCNQGTFVRKQSTVLDVTMFMVSIGRSF